MKVEARPFSALIEGRSLPWPTPMRELLKNPEAGDRAWGRITYVFQLNDPRAFFTSSLAFAANERALLERFVAHAQTLAATSLLGASDSVVVNIADAGQLESVTSDLSDPDVTVGFMTLLRQCYASDEEASFARTQKIVGSRLNDAADEAAVDVLKCWRKAHATLMNKSLEELVQERLVTEGRMPAQGFGPDGKAHSMVVRPPKPPAQMLQILWYGGQIHWGKNRDALGAIYQDPFDAAWLEIHARQAAADFAHFYTGFALLIERALVTTT